MTSFWKLFADFNNEINNFNNVNGIFETGKWYLFVIDKQICNLIIKCQIQFNTNTDIQNHIQSCRN